MELVGWRAVALPVLAQLVAIAIQVYGLFNYVPVGERIITIVVLLIATIQIIGTRPRAGRPRAEPRAEEAEAP